jgi:hypothetical protein
MWAKSREGGTPARLARSQKRPGTAWLTVLEVMARQSAVIPAAVEGFA